MPRLFLSAIAGLCLPFVPRALTLKPDDDTLIVDDPNIRSTDARQSLFLERQAIRHIFERMVYGVEQFQNASLLSGEYAVCTSPKGSDMPLTLLTLATNVPPYYLEHMRANRLKYAETQGLQYCEYTHTLDYHRKDHWSKLIAVQELFRMGHSVVAWMDADALFMRCDQSFLPILDNFDTSDVVFSADVGCKRDEANISSHIQMSVFLMRKTTFASDLLETWLGDAYVSCQHHFTQEQCAVNKYHRQMLECEDNDSGCSYWVAQHYLPKVRIVPWNYFNSPGNPAVNLVPGSGDHLYQPGDFIMHWGGGIGVNKYQSITDMFWSGACK